MKYYLRLFLSVFLLVSLFSCMAAKGGEKYATLDDPLASSRRKGTYRIKLEKSENLNEAESSRRKGANLQVREKEAQEGAGSTSSSINQSADKTISQPADKSNSSPEKTITGDNNTNKEEKNRSVFKPFIPEDKPSATTEVPPGKMPDEVKEQIINLEETSGEEYITLNFEQAPLEDIINTVSETLSLNYIVSSGIKGQITMQTAKPVPKSELFQILQSVLEVNGFTLVTSGRYFKIVQAKEATRYPLEVMSGKGEKELAEEETYITQIIPLDYIPVKEMVKILQSFLSKSAPQPIQHDELNLLILNDTGSNMKRLLKFVQELDKPLYQPKEKVFVYYVENGDAKKLADTLNAIYKKGSSAQKDARKFFNPQQQPQGGRNPQQQGSQPGINQPPMPVNPFAPFYPEGEQVEGEVTIVASEEINALIITTSPRNYPAVLETIKKLDVQPKQVLVEVLVAEITIDDVKEFGLDWSLGGSMSGGFQYHLGQDLGGGPNKIDQSGIDAIEWAGKGGINYMLAKQEKFFSLISAKVAENKFNVLSSPHILASDNQEAKIEVTDDYPIPRDSYDANNNKSTTYDYKTAGIKLSFTPKINDKGLVSLKLNQEVSQGSSAAVVDNQQTYTFSTRKAETNVVVHDGETLIIGGLVKEEKKKTRSGIPFLADIPLLGYLFSHNFDKIIKTELIILITPHVVTNEEEGTEITQKFQDRVKSLRSKIEQGTVGKDSRD